MPLPKVMLIGDSIRMSYMPAVMKALQGEAEVVGPNENCRFALYSLTRLEAWLKELGRPDIVHWNNGLHDVGHNPDRRPVQFAIDDYVGNLSLMLQALRKTGARVIWATTTPVHPDSPFRQDRWSWRNEEIDRYNAAARQIMEAQGVPINDLHSLIRNGPPGLFKDDLLHLSEQGARLCAEATLRILRAHLPSRP